MSHSNPAPLIFLAMIPMGLVLFGGMQLFSHYVFEVRLGAAAVEFVLLKRFVVWAIPRDEITRFDRISFWEVGFTCAFRLVNRPLGPYVLLHRDRGIFRKYIVSPRDADAFCNAFREQWASAHRSVTTA
jgi:hypothetical protein